MEKSNPHPKAEDCAAGTEPVDLWFYRRKRPLRSVSAVKCEPQAGPASCLSNSASKDLNASGEAVNSAEPKTDMTAKGEVMEGSPGSKSVARIEGDARNEGGPESTCRTHCESQKAYTQKHYRFGGLYRMINQDVLRLCFYRLRKDAASGVDQVTFQDYERDLEENLANLAGRLRRKAYRARWERMLEQRIADGAFLNLIRKWLRAGILEEDGRVIHPQTGTPQGGVVCLASWN